jgi:hypothetical protein
MAKTAVARRRKAWATRCSACVRCLLACVRAPRLRAHAVREALTSMALRARTIAWRRTLLACRVSSPSSRHRLSDLSAHELAHAGARTRHVEASAASAEDRRALVARTRDKLEVLTVEWRPRRARCCCRRGHASLRCAHQPRLLAPKRRRPSPRPAAAMQPRLSKRWCATLATLG